MNKKILSIVIPVYNTEKYLPRCLDSVISSINFMENDTQIIVINDGSKGNCDKIIESYLNVYKGLIMYIKQDNKGLAETKNIGIKNSIGKYISFIDSDDFVDENFYIDAFKLIYAKNADIVICDWETIDKDKKFIVPAKDERYSNSKLGYIDVQIMPSSCNKIVKKDLFNNLFFPIGLRYEDLATTLILLLRANKICYLNKPYYKYFLSDSSIMRSEFDEKKFQMIDIFEILFERLDDMNISITDKEMYKYMTYTRRFYEELLEQIAIKSKNSIEKKRLCKIFCEKICRINKLMCSNKYFYRNIFKSKSFIRNISNRILHYFINNNHYQLLYFMLDKKIYYRFISVRYIGKDIISFIEKKENKYE